MPLLNEEVEPTNPSALLSPAAAAAGDGGQCRLIKPQNKKSKFWVHFSEYDVDAHPEKKHFARCNICGREISVKQGTGGLKNHLKFKHKEENAELWKQYNEIEAEGGDDNAATGADNAGGGTTTVPGSTTPANGGDGAESSSPPKKKAKTSAFHEITARRDKEKGIKQKQDLEMWSLIRREIKDLKAELAGEDDADAIQELERDIQNLRKLKATYDEQLGFNTVVEAMV